MKPVILFLLMFLFTIGTALAIAPDMPFECYQETATEATECGGLSTGSYTLEGDYDYPGEWSNPENLYDGSWGTSGCIVNPGDMEPGDSLWANVYITYAKPEGAIPQPSLTYRNINGESTRVLDGSATQECFDADPDTLTIVMRAQVNRALTTGDYSYHTQIWCWNGASLSLISSSHSSEELGGCIWEEGITWLIDPSLIGGEPADSDSDGILDLYEEAGDTDGDGVDNYLDDDDDGDGILTADEHPDPNGDGNDEDAWDSDDDGIPDYLDSGECVVDADCDVGEVCVRNVCMVLEDEPECEVDADCPDGFECVEEFCVEVEEEPECVVDADCAVGYECVDEFCVVLEEDEEELYIEAFDEPTLVPILVPVPPCIDTDSGQDYISQGTILSGLNRADQCVNSDKLRERYCVTELAYSAEDVSCSELYGSGWGCEEGECIEINEKKTSQFFWWIILLIAIFIIYQASKKKKK